METDSFRADESFPESQLPKMGKVAMKVLSLKDEEFYEGMGRYFVTIAQEAGYGNTLLALGRRIRDFFLNLDNLHDYLKFSFPKMKAPSFFIEAEDENGLSMQYRTRRKGFHYYVQGQVGDLSIRCDRICNLLIIFLKERQFRLRRLQKCFSTTQNSLRTNLTAN